MEPSLSECQDVLRAALKADEDNAEDLALGLYTKFVEMSLRVTDPVNKPKIQKLALQSMDRAETLRNKTSPLHSHSPPPSAAAVVVENESSLKLTGGAPSTYSAEEIRVLEHGSRINNLIVVPWIQDDLKEKFIFPLPFTDPDGLLALAPKQKAELGHWLRIGELSESPSMVDSTVDYVSIRQTVVSDCSFVASLSVAALYEMRFKKALISSIVYPRTSAGRPIYNPSGKYSIKLHINGVSRKVIVDDRLPSGKYGQLLCSHSRNNDEFWVSILEKAYMKVMGGYDFPGSNSNIDLHALTGWIPERISINLQQEPHEANAIFERLQNGLSLGRCLITAATGELSEVEEKRTGLVPTHAYAVLDMREINGTKLVKMKNPWSHLRWKGNYSERDVNNWTESLKEALNYDPSKAEQVDNGIFWIDYHSVRNFFDVFYINWDPALFQHTYCVHSMWNAGVGPARDAYTIGENPQFLLKISPGKGSVWVLLTRHITSIEDFRNNREYITIMAYENQGKKVYYPYEPKPLHEGTRINSPHYLCKIRQDPNRPQNLTLVVSQYEKTNTIYYTLRAYSSSRFALENLNSGFTATEVSGFWKGITAGGCPNHSETHKNNPKFKLTIAPKPQHRSRVTIELRGPKLYQVGFEVQNMEKTEKWSSGNYRSGYCVLEMDETASGSYLIVPSTFVPGQEGPFFLTVRAQNPVKLKQVPSDT